MSTLKVIAISSHSLATVESNDFAGIWSQYSNESDSPLLAVTRRGDDADPPGDVESAAVVLPVGDPLLDVWRELPVALAARIANPSGFGWIVFDPTQSDLPEPTVAESPEWELLIHACDSGRRFDVRDAGPEDDSATEAMPPLEPAGATLPSELDSLLRSYEPSDHDGTLLTGPDAIALQAGLLQIHDCLDESHELAQQAGGAGRHANGNYWHAIMHRREPDYSNSKYWYRNVGSHPVYSQMAEAVAALADREPDETTQQWLSRMTSGGGWDPFVFVDMCSEAAGQSGAPPADAAIRLQWQEMLYLLRQTWQDAAGA